VDNPEPNPLKFFNLARAACGMLVPHDTVHYAKEATVGAVASSFWINQTTMKWTGPQSTPRMNLNLAGLSTSPVTN
jgi:hypothetical protein